MSDPMRCSRQTLLRTDIFEEEDCRREADFKRSYRSSSDGWFEPSTKSYASSSGAFAS